jgi:glutaredoxin
MTVELITKDNCNYCVNAKHLLNQKRIPFSEMKIGNGISREEVLSKFPTAKTVPIITIDGRYIGGFTELNKELNENLS